MFTNRKPIVERFFEKPFYVHSDVGLIVMYIYRKARGVVIVTGMGCIRIFLEMTNVKENIYGVTNVEIGLLRWKKVLNGFRSMDNRTVISRSRPTSSCNFLMKGTF